MSLRAQSVNQYLYDIFEQYYQNHNMNGRVMDDIPRNVLQAKENAGKGKIVYWKRCGRDERGAVELMDTVSS